MRLLRGERRGLPGRRGDRHRCRAQLRMLPAPGHGACHHALEFSLLAGIPLRRAGPGGGQYGAAQARLQRAPVRPRHRDPVPRRRPARGGVRRPHDHRLTGGAGDRRSPGSRRDPHRQRAGRKAGGGLRRASPQEERAGTGRFRSLHRVGGRRPGRGGALGRGVPLSQCRPELHRRQALHRRGRHCRRLRRRFHGGRGGAAPRGSPG